MNKQIKALLEDLIDDYIRENVEDVWFMELLDELSAYGTKNTDRAMAFGLCLIHNIDNYRVHAKHIDEEIKDIGFSKYERDSKGIPRLVKVIEKENKSYYF